MAPMGTLVRTASILKPSNAPLPLLWLEVLGAVCLFHRLAQHDAAAHAALDTRKAAIASRLPAYHLALQQALG